MPATTPPLPPAARALGIAITLTVVVALASAGVALAVTSPLLSGGHLIGAPVLIAAAGGLLARLVVVQGRAGRGER